MKYVINKTEVEGTLTHTHTEGMQRKEDQRPSRWRLCPCSLYHNSVDWRLRKLPMTAGGHTEWALSPTALQQIQHSQWIYRALYIANSYRTWVLN